MTGEGPESTSYEVLVVDDEETMRLFVQRALERAGHRVRTAGRGDEALALLAEVPADVVVSDIRMPGLDGHELLREVGATHAGTRVILMTAFGTIREAMSAVSAGVEAFLEKPFETEELLFHVAKAGESARLAAENRALRELLEGRPGPGAILGKSRAVRRLVQMIHRVAPHPGPVLITGESGTGKELVARAIHARSGASEGPFVAVHCGALPAPLVEAEIFGVDAGAFTGATEPRAGHVERAEGGSLFLDEVAEIPRENQASLLRLAEGRECMRVGGTRPYAPRCRLIAATHRDLRAEVEAGRFRAELYFRLHVLEVRVPPLRDRREDIPLLLRAFLDAAGRRDLEVPVEIQEQLMALPWPGNVRELRNLAERWAVTLEGSSIGPTDLPEETARGAPVRPSPFREALQRFEREYFERLLAEARGNVSEAARAAGLPRPTLHARLLALGLDPARFRSPRT
jgi:DNA-binding NtrC family response regulator